MTTSDERLARLKQLKHEYQEMTDSLPAHSFPASMMIRLEELEDEIGRLQHDLQVVGDDSSPEQ